MEDTNMADDYEPLVAFKPLPPLGSYPVSVNSSYGLAAIRDLASVERERIRTFGEIERRRERMARHRDATDAVIAGVNAWADVACQALRSRPGMGTRVAGHVLSRFTHRQGWCSSETTELYLEHELIVTDA